MRQNVLCLIIASIALALVCLPQARSATKISRIGFLAALPPAAISSRLEAFRRGLRELGHIEGENIIIEYRYAGGDFHRLPRLAEELVRLKVDLIVTGGPLDIPHAQRATSTIPIIMAFDNDPVGNGLVTSLSRPGGNITGLSTLSPGLSGKQLELLREITPELTRVAVIGTSALPGNQQSLKEVKSAAGSFGITLLYLDVLSSKNIETAFRRASEEGVSAGIVLASPVFFNHRTQVLKLAAKYRMPTIYFATEFVEEGGLMAYTASVADLYRRAATYVDKILKGAKAAELPVEQPTKFEFVINLKAAKQIGLTIPPSVLARANRVIR